MHTGMTITAATLAAGGLLALAGCSGGSAAPSTPPASTPSGQATGSPSTSPSASAAAAPVRTTAAGSVVTSYAVGGSPCGVATTPGAVWVSDAEAGRLLRLDPATGTVLGRTPVDPTPCEITVAYGSLWVITQSGSVDRVDPASGAVVAHIPVGAKSYQAVATPAAIWVSNRDDQTLTRIDPATNRPTMTLPVDGVDPGGMVYAGGSLWVGDDTSGATALLRIDPTSHRTTKVPAGRRPAYLTVIGGAVWVSNQEDGTVSRIDVTTGKVTATVPAGVSPVNLNPRPAPRPEIWVPDDSGNQVTRIDATTAKVLETIPADGGPAVIRAIGDDVWVTLFSAGTVLRIHPGPG